MTLLKGFKLRIRTIKHQFILNVGVKRALSFFKKKMQ